MSAVMEMFPICGAQHGHRPSLGRLEEMGPIWRGWEWAGATESRRM